MELFTNQPFNHPPNQPRPNRPPRAKARKHRRGGMRQSLTERDNIKQGLVGSGEAPQLMEQAGQGPG
jgi:hypothetical protein